MHWGVSEAPGLACGGAKLGGAAWTAEVGPSFLPQPAAASSQVGEQPLAAWWQWGWGQDSSLA